MTTSFKDTEGRTWSLDLTIGTIKRVKSMVDIDLLNISDGSMLIDLSRNPWRLVDLLYCIIKPQADKLDITDEDFGAAMGGMALRDASEAFLEGITNFFLEWSPSLGKTLRQLHVKLHEMDAKAEELTQAKINDPRIDQAMARTFTQVEAEMELSLKSLMDGNLLPSVPESSE